MKQEVPNQVVEVEIEVEVEVEVEVKENNLILQISIKSPTKLTPTFSKGIIYRLN